MASVTPPRPFLRLRPSEHRALLIFVDLLMAALALFLATYSWYLYAVYNGDFSIKHGGNFAVFITIMRVPLWYYLLPLVWLIFLVELYELHRASSWGKTIRGVAFAAMFGLILYSLVYFTNSDPNSLPRRGVASFLLLASLLTLLWRYFYIRWYKSPGLMRRVLIIGAGQNGRTLAEIAAQVTPQPYAMIGFLDDNPQKIGTDVAGLPVLAGNDQLLAVIEAHNITDLIVAISGEMLGATFQALLDAQEQGIEITRMQTTYEEILGRVPVLHLESDWVLRSFVDEARVSGFFELGKRILDVIGAIAGMAIVAFFTPFITIAILIDSGRPIFYSQDRLGRNGQIFRIHKFRTMRQDAEQDGRAQMAGEKDPRVTRVGNFLRATRLDELPQFWDVLRGEMSLVGPRAERPEWVEHFQREIPFYRSRLLVKPGITGWSQINYGYAATVEDTTIKLEYDLYYIKHRSIMMDIVIMLRTIGTVFRFKGR
jgi:exopolysaccharide biosynthesis polyprenyl glycosylphosphotransferase